MELQMLRHHLNQARNDARIFLRIADECAEVLDQVRGDTSVATSEQVPLVDARTLIRTAHVEMQKILPLMDSIRKARERRLNP